jgi:hypothetical protein
MTLKTGNATSTVVTPTSTTGPTTSTEEPGGVSVEQNATVSAAPLDETAYGIPLTEEEIQQILADVYAMEREEVAMAQQS